ncbi:hypothetical protein A2962_01745 [Candidatus Woesebacteria bacterium RIFCSPLOWO2_01_FULL_39_61]|uniref:Uncharacterized protein n=1 Tax=Candidatus Woesebacteria bacterium RIFCSPHIGHO2_02_FULL_39_13 TaxID=1802505 RepID=A0A1F7Z2A5_9BACT|nr:MAG: hypothetical protein A2692_02745 [Candidatus Woesebacteria bacterium RIFCSPHIGHO2_01_FULL_39_95]OGM33712.1 MAG: hypothetical protein A3D01_06245 [Candidatus Woesebacteria bacterium RIFCSPHIGHO2_02_FULL_39_13]OGM38389.1 MAG: hypothetical protein A3E13_01935 [Candidatus Woesebacteria bacterium RIFCSPHIGHO2_12_FULL_40_20]OGM66755.1 MAG: hypothetical protein A2962_01745 [Candidatus Woesebacteria bacterium RIFCSPLOWO2_01_FULL_39_61]
MTPVSRIKLEKQIDKLLNDMLTMTLAKQSSPKDALKLMNVLFTPTEIKMVKKRIGIIYLLNEGLDIENISKITKTTRQTVVRIRLQLAVADSEDKEYVYGMLKNIKLSLNIKNVLSAISEIDISRSTFRKEISPF